MTVELINKQKSVESTNDSGNTSRTNETGCESSSTSFESQDSRNLIINYLPQHMNESEVFSLFAAIGELESCKLVRSKETKQSLGYAFVKYKNQEHAREAVKKLNKITLGNKVIKVSFARPSKPEIKDANLYVGGLPPGTTAEDLRKLFGKFGEIITCRVVQAENSSDYYFGFVRFDTKKEATNAMEALHGKIPCPEIFPSAVNALTVKFAKTPQPEQINMYGNNVAFDMMNIWNKSPPSKISSDDVTKAYGRVHSQYIASMASAKENEERLENQNTGNRIYSENGTYYNSKGSSGCSCCARSLNNGSIQGFNVVLTNLPADASELMLYRLCSKYGAINSVQVFFEENNWFAIINMTQQEDANHAVNCLNGLLLQPYTPIKAEIY
ncbi:ELAV-like protein 2 [Thelohanellus kitauei]|uniref:ELAV-like protein 2 n=1 Tax=Thelohanellus kitauei TaxID=669202 RepID=A0A0C2NAE0_THEKT|nr:ELAV-like protein 2 [Thelohanellus kitauei]